MGISENVRDAVHALNVELGVKAKLRVDVELDKTTLYVHFAVGSNGGECIEKVVIKHVDAVSSGKFDYLFGKAVEKLAQEVGKYV